MFDLENYNPDFNPILFELWQLIKYCSYKIYFVVTFVSQPILPRTGPEKQKFLGAAQFGPPTVK